MLNKQNKQKQQGAALVTGLIFMVVLTLLVVAGMRTTILEEKMAGNARDVDIAFQAAEAALREAELSLFNPLVPLTFAATGSHLKIITPSRPVDFWLSLYNWASGAPYTGAPLAGAATQPSYVVEQTPQVRESGSSRKAGAFTDSRIYKITARGIGGSANTQVFLQSVYRVPG